ncbi:NRDE family protein [Planomonospora venezuelensis]|uniref:Uncharacterized protein with NRDE domain n=1 Tax=Planomonospora venezuelensis TaxID=1999 RepID=A0A841CZ83_PLAVE|nr:NRDE family protein [Planomonospora venezuelensis]MBB5963301.1 uncharacterized protein with NRDE domain [Planomonospora venezuelensis]GIN02706.1 hypothetical protein Pve01_43640 [Planomonospora venezuelensis]
MCTVAVSIEPDAEIPLILVGVRDEFTGRPWLPPAEHWPGLVGGRDLQAGGTWLAVDPAAGRAGALLNGHGVLAPASGRRSRGELPLLVAAEGRLPDLDLGRYDPFHLVLAEAGGARLWHWDGTGLRHERLPAGTHMIVNSGWEQGEENERVAFFRPLFAKAARPATLDGPWREWAFLATGAGLAAEDPRAMIVRRELPDGRTYGSLSVTLLALTPGGMRYDFTGDPRDPESFRRVLPE